MEKTDSEVQANKIPRINKLDDHTTDKLRKAFYAAVEFKLKTLSSPCIICGQKVTGSYNNVMVCEECREAVRYAKRMMRNEHHNRAFGNAENCEWSEGG